MSNVPNPLEFVKNLWGQMGIPGFGQGAAVAGGMPAFSAEELEKRLGELKQIRQWLEINLNMLSLQVNGLEMQLNAIKSMKSAPGAGFMQQAAEAMRSAAAVQPGFAPPGFIRTAPRTAVTTCAAASARRARSSTGRAVSKSGVPRWRRPSTRSTT